MVGSVAVRFFVGCLLLGALPGLAAAGFQESFAEGMKAVDREEWWPAVWALRQAIDQRPQETGERIKVYGMRFERYLPHYYLGLAYYRLGDCDRALPAFSRSQQANVVGGILRGRLNLYHDLCAQRLGRPGPVRGVSSPPPPGPQPFPRPQPVQPSPRPTPGPQPSFPSPSTSPSAPAPSTSPQHPSSPADVRRQVLEKAASAAETALRQGGELRRRLEERRRASPQAFASSPNAADELAAAGRLLDSARIRLDACRREGDLDGVERARDDAQGAVEVLREAAAVAGA